jgi:Asp-tRNA(Asn)/Glu-tRNA(Gln) amidotransferase C subunit
MTTDNSPEGRVRILAELVGIAIDDADLPEVANRFDSLMQELDRLADLDLEGIEPVTIFPDAEPLNAE